MSARGRAILSLLGAAILFCLPLIPEILGARRLVFRDAASTHWPWSRVAAASLAAGELPLVNPTASGGQPLLANPNAALLYPTNLLFEVLPPSAAFNLHYMLHALWALAGGRALARRLGLSEGPAFLAGAAFAFSGMTLSYVSAFWNSAPAVAWMPWVAAAAVDLARAGGLRSAIRPGAALAIAGALQALAGEPALSLLSILFAGALGLFEATSASPARARSAGRFLASAAASGLAAALLAAPLLLPLAQIVSLTSRGQRDFSLVAFGSAALAPWRLVELLFPRFDGDPGSLGLGAHWQYALHPGDIIYIWCVTLGVVPLFLILAAAATRGFWDRRAIGLGVGALAALLLAFGTSLPFYRALYEIELLRRLRYPIKFYAIVTLAAALLAGLAAERLLAAARPGRGAIAVLAAGAATFLLLFPLAAPGGWIAQRIAPHLSPGAGPPAALLERTLEVLRSDALLGLASIALLFLILSLRRSVRLRAYLLSFAAIVLALPWGLPLFVAADTRDMARPPAILASMAPEGRLWTSEEVGRFEWRSAGTSHPEMELRYSRLARVQIEELAPSTGAAFGVRYLFDKDPDGSYGFTDRLAREVLASSTPTQKARMLAAFGGRWVLSAESEGLPGARAVTGFTVAGRRLILWELPGVAPELRWAGRAHGRRSLSGALELVREGLFDAATDVVLPDRADRTSAEPPTAARLTGISIAPARGSADIAATGAGWLIFSRTYFPAWRAAVDGAPARVLLANGRDLAVAVPPGRHRVELWWDENPFRRGVILQAAGALLLLAGLLSSRFRGGAAAAPGPS
jgi:hypothetical protein